MKKAIAIVLLLILLVILTGCVKVTDSYGITRKINDGLVNVATVSGNGYFEICYDSTTMICYMKIYRPQGIAVSPYYVIGENGEPEIAVYGKNYFAK